MEGTLKENTRGGVEPPPEEFDFLAEGGLDFDSIDLETLSQMLEDAPANASSARTMGTALIGETDDLMALPDLSCAPVPAVDKPRPRVDVAVAPAVVIPDNAAVTVAPAVVIPNAPVSQDSELEAKRERRRRAIERYKVKRERRNWKKTPMHKTRTLAAGARERVNGRFVSSTRGFFSVTEFT